MSVRRWAGGFGVAAGLLLAVLAQRRQASGGKVTRPREIAEGVYWLPLGGANVYLVRSGSSWVLIDAGWANSARTIRQATEALFGPNARPAAILLTHVHPDHSGAALELARTWGCLVYAHPEELLLATAANVATLEQFANPMDRWVILPILRLMPRRRIESMLSQASLGEFARALDPDGGVPHLPDWRWIPTPGHSPGHVAFFRERDRVLLSGDAVLTVGPGSLWGLLPWSPWANTPHVYGPPWYTNWGKQAMEASFATVAGLEPRIVAPGHGEPMTGEAAERELRTLAERFGG